jgi:hypothetical protein
VNVFPLQATSQLDFQKRLKAVFADVRRRFEIEFCMKPSMGRIVHFVLSPGQECPAIITRVLPAEDDDIVDLHLFLGKGQMGTHSGEAVFEDPTAQTPNSWHWPEREAVPVPHTPVVDPHTLAFDQINSRLDSLETDLALASEVVDQLVSETNQAAAAELAADSAGSPDPEQTAVATAEVSADSAESNHLGSDPR